MPTQAPCGAPWRLAAPSRARSDIVRLASSSITLAVGRVAYISETTQELVPVQCPVRGGAEVSNDACAGHRTARSFAEESTRHSFAVGAIQFWICPLRAFRSFGCVDVERPAPHPISIYISHPAVDLFGAVGPFYPPPGRGCISCGCARHRATFYI